MKRKISLALTLAAICAGMLLAPVNIPAAENAPSLVSISFKNAKIDRTFNEDIHEYTITLEDSSAPPTLESYSITGNANIFVNYVYDETNHQIGLTATLQYDAGSSIYNFTYSNPAAYTVSSNCRLASIYTVFGELSPKINEKDTSYKLYIPSDLTELKITPVTSDINAYCAPVELILSEEQTPKITLTCTASDGTRCNYTLDIKRVDKTTEQVEAEMQQPDYVSFVEGTRLFERPEFIIAVSCAGGGIIVILILFAVTKRIAINPYDKDEKPFYSI